VFATKRLALRAIWLISQWDAQFEELVWHAATLRLLPEQLLE